MNYGNLFRETPSLIQLRVLVFIVASDAEDLSEMAIMNKDTWIHWKVSNKYYIYVFIIHIPEAYVIFKAIEDIIRKVETNQPRHNS